MQKMNLLKTPKVTIIIMLIIARRRMEVKLALRMHGMMDKMTIKKKKTIGEELKELLYMVGFKMKRYPGKDRI